MRSLRDATLAGSAALTPTVGVGVGMDRTIESGDGIGSVSVLEVDGTWRRTLTRT